MAKQVIRVPISEGEPGYVEMQVESRDFEESGGLVADRGGAAATATRSLSASLDTVMPAISTVLSRIREAAHRPDEVEIELGLTIGGETGMIFTKGTAEATFAVTITWTRPGRSDVI